MKVSTGNKTEAHSKVTAAAAFG